MTVLTDILVPRSMVRSPERFGGTQDYDCLRGDLIRSDDGTRRLQACRPTISPRMVLPALVEAHCHLDKCHSIHRMADVGGDLAEAIEAQRKDKTHWSEADLRHRMSLGLNKLLSSGCVAVRSHIDWSDVPAPPLGWSVLHELACDRSGMNIQTAALIGITQLADKEFCTQAAKHISHQSGGVLGSFVLHHDAKHIRDGLKHMFAAAERFGLALDFHVDEGLGDYNGLEAICDATLEANFQGPVLCSHAVSLIDRTEKDFKRILDKLLRTGIHVCALPTTNLYLQGRHEGTPDRRGLTRLRELSTAGVPIVVASDNVADAFCPMGQHDPLAALHWASLAAHLDPPMGNWLSTVTHNAASALGLAPVFVDDAPERGLRLCHAASTADLVAGRAPLLPLSQCRKDTLL